MSDAGHYHGDDGGEAFGTVRCLFCAAPHRLTRPPERDDRCARCASPLCAAERQRLEYSGQRMLARIPKRSEVLLYTTWPQDTPLHGTMLDVSLNGALIALPAELVPNQVIRIDGEVLGAIARVAHSRTAAGAASWLTGVEFLTLRFAQLAGTFVSTSA